MASTENIDYKSIGVRIKAARLKKDFTQPKLAEFLNVSPEYISRLERASSHPGLPMIAEIARVLDVSLVYLIEGTTKSADEYKLNEFAEILKVMSPEQRKTLFEIAKVLLNSD
jgi:transcriptional regulator with XRE-family HTH domain